MAGGGGSLDEIFKKKIVLLGDAAVGKSSLVQRFVQGFFDDRYIATIGTNVNRKTVEFERLGAGKVRMEFIIWDVLGQKGFERVKTQAYRGAEGALLVCDLSRPATIDSLRSWAAAMTPVSGQVPMIILANKLDLVEPDDKHIHKAAEVARSMGHRHFLTSAKSGVNVEEAFRALGRAIYSGQKETVVGAVPKLNPKVVADIVMDSFCELHGGYEMAMPLVQKAFTEALVDVTDIKSEGLRQVVKVLERRADLAPHELEAYRSFINELERQLREGTALGEEAELPEDRKEALTSFLVDAAQHGDFDLERAWIFDEK